MTIPTFNAANLRKLTDASRQPLEIEHARLMFKELQCRAWHSASQGKTTAGLSPNQSRSLGTHGLLALREMAEGADLQFFSKNGDAVWVTW
jgi:hypothetical protein